MPFALREKVEETLLRQVEEGELEQVESSEWAAPIVIVRKKGGDIRICADFKRTIIHILRRRPFHCPLRTRYSQHLPMENHSQRLILPGHTNRWRSKKAAVNTSQSTPTWGYFDTVVYHLGFLQHLLYGRRRCQ